MDSSLIPPEDLIKLVGGVNASDYEYIGKHFFEIFTKYGGLKKTDRVLDVGCGCGRMAIPLLNWLTTGSYEGFDIVPSLVQWCQQHITPKYPKFTFDLSRVGNEAYVHDKRIKASEYHFPYPDEYFDFTFLTSVFTHMLPLDLANYTREIARTLKPGGTALITFFILNEEAERYQKTGDVKIKIPYAFGTEGLKIGNPKSPEDVIGYPEPMMRKLLTENGLAIQEPIHFGFWSGRPSEVTMQDVVVTKKR